MFPTDSQTPSSQGWPASADEDDYRVALSTQMVPHEQMQPWKWQMMDQSPQSFTYSQSYEPSIPCGTVQDFELYQLGFPLNNDVNSCVVGPYEASFDSGWSDSSSTPWSSPEQANGDFVPFSHQPHNGCHPTPNGAVLHDGLSQPTTDQSSYRTRHNQTLCDSPMQSTSDCENSRACSIEQDWLASTGVTVDRDAFAPVIRRRRAGTASTSSTNRTRTTTKPRKDKQARNFICPFAIYGCPLQFTSKNEWKRHSHSQHMRLDFWRCDQCSSANRAPNDFNRKDLFYQHIRRMHPLLDDESSAQVDRPVSNKPRSRRGDARSGSGAVSPEEEAYLASAARSCHYQPRQAPQRCACLLCEHIFVGPRAWEDRLEHIGRHHEADKKQGKPPVDPAFWRQDVYTEAWLKQEGLIELDMHGKWVLLVD